MIFITAIIIRFRCNASEAGLDTSGRSRSHGFIAAPSRRSARPSRPIRSTSCPSSSAWVSSTCRSRSRMFGSRTRKRQHMCASAGTGRCRMFLMLSRSNPSRPSLPTQLGATPRTIARDHRARSLIDPTSLGDAWNHGEDPKLYPIDTGRLRRVIETAARGSAGGVTLEKGRGLGIAGHYSFVTYVAAAVEVEVSDRGRLTILRIDIAIDCGPVVNPERIRSQMEGAAIMGAGLCQPRPRSRSGTDEQSRATSIPTS